MNTIKKTDPNGNITYFKKIKTKIIPISEFEFNSIMLSLGFTKSQIK